jgi:hypothetical protein
MIGADHFLRRIGSSNFFFGGNGNNFSAIYGNSMIVQIADPIPLHGIHVFGVDDYINFGHHDSLLNIIFYIGVVYEWNDRLYKR